MSAPELARLRRKPALVADLFSALASARFGDAAALRAHLMQAIADFSARPGMDPVVASFRRELELLDSGTAPQASHSLHLDNTWQALESALCGELPASRRAITGAGQPELGPSISFGAARLLEPHEVRESAEALEALGHAFLVRYYESGALRDAHVHGGFGQDPDDAAERDLLVEAFDRVVSFYRAAAAEGDAVLAVVV